MTVERFLRNVCVDFRVSVLRVSELLYIFAASKFKVRYDAAGPEPAFFIPSRLENRNNCTVSASGNAPEVSHFEP